VGPKSAQRIAFHILNADAADMARLANAISTVKTSVSFCEECGNVSETKLCTICRDERRDPSVLCVVEESKDVVAILPAATMCSAALLTRWRVWARSSCVFVS